MVKELGMDNTVNTKGGSDGQLKKAETVCPVVVFEKKFTFVVRNV